MEVWYRMEDRLVASPMLEADIPLGPPRVLVNCYAYQVLRHTKKGVWLYRGFGLPDRFVLKDAKKQWACPSVSEARDSFLARKKRQEAIYKTRLRQVSRAIDLVKADRFLVYSSPTVRIPT